MVGVLLGIVRIVVLLFVPLRLVVTSTGRVALVGVV